MPTAGRGAPPPARRRHHHRRSVLLSWFHGRVVVSAVDGTRGRIMVVEMAVPISTLELQSREADAMISAVRGGDTHPAPSTRLHAARPALLSPSPPRDPPAQPPLASSRRPASSVERRSPAHGRRSEAPALANSHERSERAARAAFGIHLGHSGPKTASESSQQARRWPDGVEIVHVMRDSPRTKCDNWSLWASRKSCRHRENYSRRSLKVL